MPQLEAHDWAPQLIWLAITFIGLYIIMAKAVIPRIGGVLEQRRDKIAGDLDQAQKFKNETEKAIEEYEAALAEAKSRAHAIAEEARNKLAAETQNERTKLEAELAERLAAAERSVKQARDDAMGQLRDVAADAAGAIVQELIGAKITKTKMTGALKKAQANRA